MGYWCLLRWFSYLVCVVFDGVDFCVDNGNDLCGVVGVWWSCCWMVCVVGVYEDVWFVYCVIIVVGVWCVCLVLCI